MGLGPLVCTHCNKYTSQDETYWYCLECWECGPNLKHLFCLTYIEAVKWDEVNGDNLRTFYKEHKESKCS